MITDILPKTYLASGEAASDCQRGTLDGRPLEIRVVHPEHYRCPITIISAGETLLTLDKRDARLLAEALLKAARSA